MEFLNKVNLNAKTVLKVFGLAFLGIILIAFAFKLIGSSFSSVSRLGFDGLQLSKNMDYSESASGGFGYNDSAAMSLSARNIAPSPVPGSTGGDAEEFEVTEYSGSIETRELEKTCETISSLKAKDYIIFENANQYDRGCSYNFKVEKNNKQEVLEIIEALNPKDLSENTRTIKRLIDDFTSEEEILNKKKTTIEETLNNAINSYDEIARVATQARDAESLAKIIDSKIRIIEKLSEERININAQLDRLGRSKAEQLDRLEYVYFNINVYENKFIDGELIKDSWKYELKTFVNDVNDVLQNSSIGLVKILFYVLQFALYLLVAVIAAKYGWKILRKIWTR